LFLSIIKKENCVMAGSLHEAMSKFPISHHHEITETFADQLGLVTADGGTMRFQFCVGRMNEPKPPAMLSGERHIVCRLVLSIPCAIDLINQVNKLAEVLAKNGTIKLEGGAAKPGEKLN
jgi:hypothetical protein